jgi:hypothetical protein
MKCKLQLCKSEEYLTENEIRFICTWIIFVIIVAGVCPVLCSNHGKYGGGLCHCEEGWKGPECDIPEHDCQVPDCSGHGQCLAGVCVCQPGWKGTFCEHGEYWYLLISENSPKCCSRRI